SAVLFNEGKSRYLAVTVIPMVVVGITTSAASVQLLRGHWVTWQTQFANAAPNWKTLGNSGLQAGLILIMLACAYTVVACSAARILLHRPIPRDPSQKPMEIPDLTD